MAEPEVLTSFQGGLGTITLNRAAKLNALNLNMIRLLHSALDKVEEQAGQLSAVIMDGAGGKAFCAGGDVAELREESIAGGSLPADFFYEEFAAVGRLATIQERTGTCQVSLWDGITMGGGVGVSIHGPFRVATEKTVFAMPEMAIGYFPDVGAMYKLGRLRLGSSVGIYLGVTGARLKAKDCLLAGLATHFVPSAKLPLLRDLLRKHCTPGLSPAAAAAACEDALRTAGGGAEPPAEGSLLTEENVAIIHRCFGSASLEEVVEKLRAEPGKFAATTLQTMLASCSPTSCKVTLRAMQQFLQDGISVGESLEIEYRLSQRFMRPQPLSDFYEGIRAVLVDKDRKQRWNPSWGELDRITAERVQVFFSPLEPTHSRGELQLKDLARWSQAGRPAFRKVELRAKL